MGQLSCRFPRCPKTLPCCALCGYGMNSSPTLSWHMDFSVVESFFFPFLSCAFWLLIVFLLAQDSSQAIPLVVESCIRFISRHGKFSGKEVFDSLSGVRSAKWGRALNTRKKEPETCIWAPAPKLKEEEMQTSKVETAHQVNPSRMCRSHLWTLSVAWYRMSAQGDRRVGMVKRGVCSTVHLHIPHTRRCCVAACTWAGKCGEFSGASCLSKELS